MLLASLLLVAHSAELTQPAGNSPSPREAILAAFLRRLIAAQRRGEATPLYLALALRGGATAKVLTLLAAAYETPPVESTVLEHVAPGIEAIGEALREAAKGQDKEVLGDEALVRQVRPGRKRG